MSTALTAVPPALAMLLGSLLVALVPHRGVRHLLGALLGLAVAVWVAVVEPGAHVGTRLFGFDAVLFLVDPHTRLIAASFGFIAAMGLGYAYSTGGDSRQVTYVLLYAASGIGTATAGDWLSLVVFWEALAVAGTLLVWHRSGDHRIGVRYAIYHEIGGLALMAGVLLHYRSAGTFLFGDGVTAGLPALLVAGGIGLNAGFLGLHVWMIDAYPQTHVATSVILSAITTKVGAYALLRAFPDGQTAVAYVGGAMVVFGVTFAVLQTDVRRLLSYHVVSQVGYIVAGYGVGTGLAQAGATVHVVNNVLYKSLLFMVAGALVVRCGQDRLEAISGAGRAMPLVAPTFAVGALSIAGVPGFNGFVSKGMVVDAVEAAGIEPLWWLLVVGGVGTVLSFAKFGYYAFVSHPGEHEPAGGADVLERSPTRVAVTGTLAAVCLLVGLAPGLVLSTFPDAAVGAAKPFAASQFAKAIAAVAVGLVGFALVRPLLGRITGVPDLEVVYEPLGAVLLARSLDAAAAIDGVVAAVERSLSTATSRLGDRPAWTGAERKLAVDVGTGVAILVSVLVGVLVALLL